MLDFRRYSGYHQARTLRIDSEATSAPEKRLGANSVELAPPFVAFAWLKVKVLIGPSN
jgi:hypothetical protein